MNSEAKNSTTPKKVLKDLVEILHDGQEGFRKASEDVKDPQLKELFSRFSLQRSSSRGNSSPSCYRSAKPTRKKTAPLLPAPSTAAGSI